MRCNPSLARVSVIPDQPAIIIHYLFDTKSSYPLPLINISLILVVCLYTFVLLNELQKKKTGCNIFKKHTSYIMKPGNQKKSESKRERKPDCNIFKKHASYIYETNHETNQAKI
jgi:hypothetical protein